jgi:hypothetical protein
MSSSSFIEKISKEAKTFLRILDEKDEWIRKETVLLAYAESQEEEKQKLKQILKDLQEIRENMFLDIPSLENGYYIINKIDDMIKRLEEALGK